MTGLRALVDRHLGAFNARDTEGWMALVDEDVVLEVDGATLRGREAVRRHVQSVPLSFRSMRAELDRVVLETGDTIVFEYRLLLADPERPRGARYLQGRICQIMRVRDGRIAELRSFYASMDAEGPVAPTRSEAMRMAAEQTGLRRVATLVARGISQDELFAAVNEEIARLVCADLTALLRFEPGGDVTLVAAWAGDRGPFPVGARRPADALLLGLAESGRARRIGGEDLARVRTFADVAERLGIRTAVGVPVMVGGRVWGASFVAAADPDAFPPDTEDRIAGFAELVETAIANAQARSQLAQVAEEQRALRQVATLVAGGASQSELFAAVAQQASRVLGGPPAALLRYGSEGDAVVVAASGGLAVPGMRVAADGGGIAAAVQRCSGPVRVDSYATLEGAAGDAAREVGMRAAVGAPIVVAGVLWGTVIAMSDDEPLPPVTEDRLAKFAALVATAIDNTESAAELSASRARVVAAADESRHRIQRDLQEGAERRLVETTTTLRLAAGAIGDAGERVSGLLRESLDNAERATAELQELARGMLPAALDHGGLRAGVESLVAQMDLPVQVDVPAGRLPRPVETTAYFVVAEALTNALKHSGAAHARVRGIVDEGALALEIADDGVGGADPAGGTGLLGLADRVAAAGGAISIASPPGGGTTLAVTVPVALDRAR